MRRLRHALAVRRNTRRLWGAVGSGLMVPPPRAFGAFGAGALIIPPTRVQAPECIYIGERAQIHEHVWFCVVPQEGLPAPRLTIGARARLTRFVKIVCTGEVVLGDEVGISDGVFITDTHYRHDDPATPIHAQGLSKPSPVRIGRGAFLGVRAIIHPGVTVGDNAYIGAGAVVMEDVPARTVVVGNPARVVQRYDESSDTWVTVP